MTSIKQTLDTMLKRCLTLHGTTFQEVDGKKVAIGTDEAVREFMKLMASDSTSPREVADKIIAAWDDKTGALQTSLNAARVTAVGNFIATESVFKSAFFSTVSLQPDEEAFYTNTTQNEQIVGLMGEDGTPERTRVVRSQARTPIGIYALSSKIVRYKTLDIYKGDVSQTVLGTINTARDLTFKLDRVHYDLLNASLSNGGCYGAFSFEQTRSNKATRIYNAHSGIVTAHLPTTNDIVNGTTSGTGGTRFTVQYYDTAATNLTGFRPAVLRAIIDYATSWGNVLPEGGSLVPSGDIIVPASDIINIALGLLPANNDTAGSLQAQVQEQGYFSLNLLNKNWRFIPDLTITSGTCFPRFNLVPGLSYEKPSFDREFVTRNDIENWEERFQRKAYGLCIPAQYRPRGLRIKYIA